MRKLPTCGICKETIPFDQKTYSIPEIGVYRACEKCHEQFMDFKDIMDSDQEMKSWFDMSSLLSGVRMWSLAMTIISTFGMVVSGVAVKWTSALVVMFGIVAFLCCGIFILSSMKRRDVKRQQPSMEQRLKERMEEFYTEKAKQHGNSN